MGYSFDFSFSEEDFDDTCKDVKYFSYGDFYINEFFISDDNEKAVIYQAYRKIYGDSAFNYFLRNYAYSWKAGDRRMSDTQWSRIATLVRNNLTDSSRLKLGRIEFFRVIKSLLNDFFIDQKLCYKREKIKNINDLNNIFKSELTRNKKFDSLKYETKNIIEKLRVLNDDEKKEAIEVADLIRNIKLETQINHIIGDLKTFIPFFSNNNLPSLKCIYKIEAFNLSIDIENISNNDIITPDFNETTFLYKSKYKRFVDKYLANELVELNKESNIKSFRNDINKFELTEFLNNVKRLKESKERHEIKCTFFGEGGELNLELVIRHQTLILTEIAKALLYFILITGSVFGVLIWIFKFNPNGFLLILGIYGFFAYFSIISKYVDIIYKGIKDLIKYGK